MAENKLIDMSMDFAVEVITLCDTIKGHYSLKDQLMRSSSSIGANIREANYAQSKTDFVYKLQISLKECYETEYWVELFKRTKIIDTEIANNLLHDCGSIRRVLISSINTAKNN